MAALAGTGGGLDDGHQLAQQGTELSDADVSAAATLIDHYAVINVAPTTTTTAYLNARAQAAFDYWDGTRYRARFFNGQRLVEISPPDASRTFVHGLNKYGMVAGIMLRDEAMPIFEAYRWTSGSGMTTLPPLAAGGGAWVGGINNRGDIVGLGVVPGAPSESYQAVRWTPSNVLASLAPAGFTASSAGDVNDASNTAGYAVAADGRAHAFVWNAYNRAFDLGTMGGTSAVAHLINERGDVAGQVSTDLPAGDTHFQGFLWSNRLGRVRFGEPGTGTVIHALNELGEVAGRVVYDSGASTHAFFYSRSRGLVDLHAAPHASSIANDLNGDTVVGWMGGGTEPTRAYRWRAGSAPVDLNSRLVNKPAGLVLHEAVAISPAGDILAQSNAGLVMLRACACGTDAPVLGPILGPEAQLNEAWTISLGFRDRNAADTHSATIDWGDGSPVQTVSVTESGGQGSISATHTYTEQGDFMVTVSITDSTGRTTQVTREEIILVLGGPGLSGAGMLPGAAPAMDDARARAAKTSLRFVLAAPLAAPANPGQGFGFHLRGAMHFSAERLDQLTRQGDTVRLEGTGRLNGQAGYRFAVEATDGEAGAPGASDRLAVRITRVPTHAGGQELVALEVNANARPQVPVASQARGSASARAAGVVLPGTAIRLHR
jgi:uncharacterized membrane protein